MNHPLLFALVLTILLNSCSQKKDDVQSTAGDDAFSMTVDEQATSATRDMKLNVPVGTVYRYKNVQAENLVQDDTMSVSSTTTSYYTKTITANAGGIISFTVRYDSIMETQVGKGMGADNKTISYRSTDSVDKSNPKYATVNSLIGKDVSVTINERGRIEEISGLAGIVQSIATASKQALSDTLRMQLAEQIKQVYYVQLVTQEHASMPERSLDSTRRWTKSLQQQMPPVFLANSTMTYAIAAVGKRNNQSVARVDATLNGTIGLINPKIPVTISKGEISGTGKALVDITTGHTLYKTTSITQFLTASAENPQTKKTDSVKQQKKSTLSVTLL